MTATSTFSIERALATVAVTVAGLGICGGLAWWIWLDRFNRRMPTDQDLVELKGVASAPQVRNRSRTVWFRFEANAPESPPPVTELRAQVRDPAALAAGIGQDRLEVSARVVRAELGRGPREGPPSVLELRTGGRVLVSLSETRELRAAQAANARLSAWIAAVGIGVVVIALGLHWAGRLRG